MRTSCCFCAEINMNLKSILVVLLAFICFSFTLISAQGPVDDYCLNCICQEGCAITYNFWLDAGKPTVNGDNPGSEYAYNNCFESYDCSARAIQNYMYRYQRDCNEDGQIDCYDHAAIHRHGADACYFKEPDLFQFQVYNCLNRK